MYKDTTNKVSFQAQVVHYFGVLLWFPQHHRLEVFLLQPPPPPPISIDRTLIHYRATPAVLNLPIPICTQFIPWLVLLALLGTQFNRRKNLSRGLGRFNGGLTTGQPGPGWREAEWHVVSCLQPGQLDPTSVLV